MMNLSFKERAKDVLSDWMYGIVVAIVFFVFGALMNRYVLSSVNVNGASMEPTLQQSDRLILNKLGKPDVGDIVVFPEPGIPDGDEPSLFIKRVIGVAGDDVKIENGRLYVNDQEVLESYTPYSGPDFNLPRDDEGSTVVVPEGHLFVLGDNRDHSLDSRVFGFLPEEAVMGEVDVRFYPFNRFTIGL